MLETADISLKPHLHMLHTGKTRQAHMGTAFAVDIAKAAF